MPKKSAKPTAQKATPEKTVASAKSLAFPEIDTGKTWIEPEIVVPDQIVVFHGFFSSAECKAYINFIDSLPLELTPPKKRGEALRVNYRISITSESFAQKLHSLITPHLPHLPCPAYLGGGQEVNEDRKPVGCNPNIRLYKYAPDQHFGAHYDDSVRDAVIGTRSEWTLLVYLTGIEDGVEGGETIFYKNEKCRPEDTIKVPLMRGTALIHRHGQDCMLHEGSKVLKGNKYVLRTDLMFK